MNKLKLICLTTIQWLKQAFLLRRTAGNSLKHKRRQVVQNVHEVERLDRLRNPSNYQGK